MITKDRHGPWAIVVGGSEALGASFAHEIGKAGINVVLVARKPEPLEAVADSVRTTAGVEVRSLSLDLARDDMLERIREVTDDVDIGLLVYNAGAAHRTGSFLEGALDDALRTARVNAIGHLTLSHHFGTKMAARERGGIVIIGSIAGQAGGIGIVTYCASKAFAQILAEGLWAELTPLGIDVLGAPLGAMNSPAMARIGLSFPPERKPADPDEQARQILDNLQNGPIFVPPHLEENFRRIAALPRKDAIAAVSGRMVGIKD
jgi:short-subunit dehydrogenase